MRKKVSLLLVLLLLLTVILPVPAQAVNIISMGDQEITLGDKKAINHLEQYINDLEYLGIDPYILKNTIIKVYPNDLLLPGTDNVVAGYVIGNIIHIGSYSDNAQVFYHELGHVIDNLKFNTDGYNWENANSLAQQYIDIVGYNNDLSAPVQENLSWENRIGEWFAEDVSYFLCYKTKGIKCYKAAGPEMSPALYEFLDDLIFGQETIKKTITWNRYGQVIGVLDDDGRGGNVDGIIFGYETKQNTIIWNRYEQVVGILYDDDDLFGLEIKDAIFWNRYKYIITDDERGGTVLDISSAANTADILFIKTKYKHK